MKKIVLKLLLPLFLVGCTEDAKIEIPPDCKTRNYALLTVSNTSANPYSLYANDKLLREVPGSAILKDIQVTAGNIIKLYAEQKSGFILYPTKVNATVNMIPCEDYALKIP